MKPEGLSLSNCPGNESVYDPETFCLEGFAEVEFFA
jgi:hypothetical protein